MWNELRDWTEELVCRAGLDGVPWKAVAAGLLTVVAIGAIALWVVRAQPASGAARPAASAPVPVVSSVPDSATTTPALVATVTVHVVGEVHRPGVYDLAGGARARDAVNAAGGLLGCADQAAINLARVVADGEQILVPRQGQGGTTASASTAAASTPHATAPAKPSKVDLNSATAEQLDTLPGVGPATAAKIIADRTANGPFRTVDDLLRVPGIGPAKLDGMKDLVTVG